MEYIYKSLILVLMYLIGISTFHINSISSRSSSSSSAKKEYQSFLVLSSSSSSSSSPPSSPPNTSSPSSSSSSSSPSSSSPTTSSPSSSSPTTPSSSSSSSSSLSSSSPSPSPSSSTTSISLLPGFNEKEIQNRLRELGEPLLDFDLIRRTLNAWTRPIPSSYPTMPLILVGPSGVGKGRLVKALLKDYTRYFVKLVTHTTRQPRPDEIEGVSYHYVCNDTFHNMVKDNKFVEWAKVHDNYYGTSVEALTLASQKEKICILEIDIQGALSIKEVARKYGLNPRYVFISPPAIGVLKKRLQERGTETKDQIELRLKNAEIEIKRAEDSKLFGKVLVNEDFDETSKAFFRLMKDWYPALPSISRLRMVQRRIRHIKTILSKKQSIAVDENQIS